MNYAGIDLGSRFIKLALVDENATSIHLAQVDTGFDPLNAACGLLENTKYDYLLATGYGRELLEIENDSPTITEIRAHARGAAASFPGASAVVDIGGQDSKVISIDEKGRVRKFEMNDRCAAGTGKFLEMMAKTLNFEMEDFGDEALKAETEIRLSSMCTVFAESEVISVIAKGGDRRSIAKGVHMSVVDRISGMLSRTAPNGDIVFTGGVASNSCMQKLLAERTSRKILVSDKPQFTGALGAALIALEKNKIEQK
ncbi:MAG: 3-hydroxyacyl-ACP dehydratase [Elusimicrobia bacterium]|nr:3-hydroxyacyl-ACP dehydratase [Elusimicrobiota bacterium]